MFYKDTDASEGLAAVPAGCTIHNSSTVADFRFDDAFCMWPRLVASQLRTYASHVSKALTVHVMRSGARSNTTSCPWLYGTLCSEDRKILCIIPTRRNVEDTGVPPACPGNTPNAGVQDYPRYASVFLM